MQVIIKFVNRETRTMICGTMAHGRVCVCMSESTEVCIVVVPGSAIGAHSQLIIITCLGPQQQQNWIPAHTQCRCNESRPVWP